MAGRRQQRPRHALTTGKSSCDPTALWRTALQLLATRSRHRSTAPVAARVTPWSLAHVVGAGRLDHAGRRARHEHGSGSVGLAGVEHARIAVDLVAAAVVAGRRALLEP